MINRFALKKVAPKEKVSEVEKSVLEEKLEAARAKIDEFLNPFKNPLIVHKQSMLKAMTDSSIEDMNETID
jgi:hypothetical protein